MTHNAATYNLLKILIVNPTYSNHLNIFQDRLHVVLYIIYWRTSTYWVRSRLQPINMAGDNIAVCAICLVNLYIPASIANVYKLNKCKHTFHVQCIQTWIKWGKKSCPYCRMHISNYNIE